MREKIREFMIGLLAGIIMLIAVFTASYIESNYSMDAEVKTVGSCTVFEDSTENTWVVYDTDYKVGEKVELKFFNQFTDRRADDEIVAVIRK